MSYTRIKAISMFSRKLELLLTFRDKKAYGYSKGYNSYIVLRPPFLVSLKTEKLNEQHF